MRWELSLCLIYSVLKIEFYVSKRIVEKNSYNFDFVKMNQWMGLFNFDGFSLMCWVIATYMLTKSNKYGLLSIQSSKDSFNGNNFCSYKAYLTLAVSTTRLKYRAKTTVVSANFSDQLARLLFYHKSYCIFHLPMMVELISWCGCNYVSD